LRHFCSPILRVRLVGGRGRWEADAEGCGRSSQHMW
jgi:hypothetical protein